MCVSAAVSRACHLVTGEPSRFCQPASSRMQALDAFWANAVQEPRIGADHAVGGLGVDEDWFKDVGVGEQVQELDLRDRVPERVD